MMDFHSTADNPIDFTSPNLPRDVQSSIDRAPAFSTPKRMAHEMSAHVCSSTSALIISSFHYIHRTATRRIRRRAYHQLRTEPIP